MKQNIQGLNILQNMDAVDTYSIEVTELYSSIRTHIWQMSDIIIFCILTVITQHSTSSAGHSAGVD